MKARSTTEKALSAVAALAVAIGLFACANHIEKLPGADPELSDAAGSDGGDSIEQEDSLPDDSLPDDPDAGVSSSASAEAPTTVPNSVPGIGPATGGPGGTPPSTNAPSSDVGEPIPDPGPLQCVAPDREAYKAEHGQDPGSVGEDAGAPDDPLDLDSAGMEHTALIVFDKSGSMEGNWDGRTKWQVANDTMIETISPFQHYLSVGAIFFPTDHDCGVAPIESDEQIDFLPGGDFLAEWETSMDRYAAMGATPMSVAFQRADQAIFRACETGVLERPFKVIVLTDGEPNCGSDLELLTSLPAKWRNHGIKTHVVGLPGSGPARSILESMARAGGTDTFFWPSEPDEFEQTMHVLLQ